MELIKHDLPVGFTYPEEFMTVINQGLTDLEPWAIMSGEYLKDRYEGLKKRYKEGLVPFARRLDNDDLACWDIDVPEKVVIIHDFASKGWEKKKVFNSFWEWFRQAVEDMIEFNS
jgi:hypothetical protein